MRLNAAITTLGLASLAYAAPQVDRRGTYETGLDINAYYSSDTAPTPAPAMAATGTNWDVTVGGTAGLVYTPEYIMANVGDTVTFHFGTKNHTATQSTFDIPCGAMTGGHDSGFEPTDGSTTPTFQITVSVSTPLWFYCRQANHCQMGMVFAINPPTSGDKTFQSFKNLAMGVNTVTATSTTATTVAVTAPPPPPPPAVVTGYNSGDNANCQCVCNLAQANGAPLPNQGLGVFGGDVGNVQAPWAFVGSAPVAPPAAPPAPPPVAAPASAPPPADTAAAATQTCTSQASTIGGFANLGQGTVVPIGNAASLSVNNDPPTTTTFADVSSSTPDTNNEGNSNVFSADGALGGAAGRR